MCTVCVVKLDLLSVLSMTLVPEDSHMKQLGAETSGGVQVLRFCDGSYLEDQDHWWLSGLHRCPCRR